MMTSVTAPPGPVPSLERRMVDAYRGGERAARDRGAWNSNPHHATSQDAVERLLSILWRKGYQKVVDERLPAGFPR